MFKKNILEAWIPDDRFPGWEFKFGLTSANKTLLEGRNIEKGLSGEVFVNDEALANTKTAVLEIDQKVKYLVDCASVDIEEWLASGN